MWRSTMLMKRTSPLWMSSSESQLFTVSLYVTLDHNVLQSLRDCQRWPGWTSSPVLVACVDSALESALCLSLRLSTGSLSDFAKRSEFKLIGDLQLSIFGDLFLVRTLLCTCFEYLIVCILHRMTNIGVAINQPFPRFVCVQWFTFTRPCTYFGFWQSWKP